MPLVQMVDDDTVVLEVNSDYVHELERLRVHNRVLASLCGIAPDPEVLRSAVAIQSHTRSFLMRQRAQRRAAATRVVRTAVGGYRGRRAFAAVRRATLALQARARGAAVRATPIGRAVRRIREYEHDLLITEIALLRHARVAVCAMERG